jgi:hypothetical protein
MKVWIIHHDISYEGGDVISVWSSEEKAKVEIVKAKRRKYLGYGTLSIREHEVDVK